MASLSTDDRALASGIIGAVMMLVAFALLYVLFNPAFDLTTQSANSVASSTTAVDAIDQRATIWDNLPFFALSLVFLFLIARAVFEGGGA